MPSGANTISRGLERVAAVFTPSVLPALQRNPSLAAELARVSQARREASGLVDAESQRTTLLQRCGTLLRAVLGELRPW